jgi:hypothetical protein
MNKQNASELMDALASVQPDKRQAILNKIDAHRDRADKLAAMLAEVGQWECQGRRVAEQFDLAHGAGSWRRALKP